MDGPEVSAVTTSPGEAPARTWESWKPYAVLLVLSTAVAYVLGAVRDALALRHNPPVPRDA
ncbi:hypothetical protein AFM16_30370 [Streptomyces antibioticus]|uniref:Uncharacterized protein n=1 Tax=Streptomyces antibioticus TaxID=1890 RepID=A0ABX3L8V0_STRAT|nr:hypothetical protein AFM16_30370 [Streptomyces antibioticus]